MKKNQYLSRLLLASTALLGLGYTKGTSTNFSYYAYTNEVTAWSKFTMSVQVWNETSSTITVNAYEFALYSSSGNLLSSKGEDRTNGYPRTLAKGDSPIVLSFSYTPTAKFQIHFHMYGQVGSRTQMIDINYTITPGTRYGTSSNPLVISKDQEVAPGRSTYDFCARQAGASPTKTYKYNFVNVKDMGYPYLAAFNVRVFKKWVETNKYTIPTVSSAQIVIHSHLDEFRYAADAYNLTTGDCTFYLSPVSMTNRIEFALKKSIYMDKGTGAVSKNSYHPSREIKTTRIPLPQGKDESSTTYSWDLTFKLDNDYVRIPFTQTNNHVGLGNPDSKYVLTLG